MPFAVKVLPHSRQKGVKTAFSRKLPFSFQAAGGEKFDNLEPEYSHLYLAASGRLAGVICIADPLRPEASRVLRALRGLGITNTVMMTGDSERTAAAIAKQVGVDQFFAEVLPEDKAAFVQKAKSEGHTVVMIGDGINDSPALSAADVGIAINSGAAIAREIADVTIKADSLEELVVLKTIANALQRRVSANYRFVLTFNSALIALGAMGILQPASLCHAAQPLHHRHQPQEHDQPHPRGKGSEGSGRKELNPIRYKNTGCA